MHVQIDFERLRLNIIRDQLEIHAHDQKRFRKHIQGVIPSASSSNKTINLKDLDNNNHVDVYNTADYINDFFVNIGPNIAKECHLD